MLLNMPTFGSLGKWIDIGGGTAWNIEYFSDNLNQAFNKVIILDLCKPLLDIWEKRVELNKQNNPSWKNVSVELIEGDWTDEGLFSSHKELKPNTADVITFSYSLTMIPNWRK